MLTPTEAETLSLNLTVGASKLVDSAGIEPASSPMPE